jgi:cell division protein FtsI (penicillin-binding protein 3)
LNIKKSILIRVRIAFIGVVIFAVCVAAKISHIQVVEGEKWKRMANDIMFDYKTVKATRGNIYSDNGSLLATSLPFYRVAMDPTHATKELFDKSIDSLSRKLAGYFRDRAASDYRNMISDARKANKRYLVLNRKRINYQAKKEMTLWPMFREGRYKGGVIFEKTDIRYNPFTDLSKRTIGFVNEDGAGAGLEKSFNEALGGQNGEALFQKIAGGTWMPVFDGDDVKAIDGNDIQTTLDVNLQDVAETSLHRHMALHDADEGTVVVMEVATGHIKAISNLTRVGKDNYQEKFNHAVGGSLEPGSTFKLVTMMALLEDTDVELTDSIATGDGVYQLYREKVRDHEDGGYGTISVRRAFEVSSNIAMAKLANKHFGTKPDNFLKHIDQLRLSKPLGLQINGETIPKFKRPTDKDWSRITIPWMAYGYGLEISPLQTLTLYNAIANEGRMIKPIFVTAVRQADNTIKEFETETMNSKICSNGTLKKLQDLLESVVENGTAKNLKNAHYRIAGKTGTAQILENGHYTRKYITSFVGYFPAHAPKYTAIVVVKNPKGVYQYGNNVAGPVFKEITDNIYARDIGLHSAMAKGVDPKDVKEKVFPVIRAGLQEDLNVITDELGIAVTGETEEEWVKAARNGNSVLWNKNVVSKERVPDVTGMTFRDALFLLESSGLRVIHHGIGRVKEQSLTPGAKVLKGSRIFIKLS